MNHIAVLCLTSACALAGAAPMVPIYESWDSYSPGSSDLTYLEAWVTIPGAQRYEVVTGPEGAATVWSPPHGLKVGKEVTCGITRDITPEITAVLPDATSVNGTDDSMLQVVFFVDFNRDAGTTQDIFVELSRGDVHVDAAGGTPVPVIAFGMTAGMHGPSGSPRIFNGEEWLEATGVVTDKRSNHFSLELRSDLLRLTGAQNASGVAEVERAYRGGFDRLSIRTVSNTHRAHIVDNLLIEGGTVETGAAPLFKRGDVNADGDVNIADAIFVLTRLFGGGGEPACVGAADANDDGEINIADAVAVLGHLFGGAGPLPDPFGACGTDPTDDSLDCRDYPPCAP